MRPLFSLDTPDLRKARGAFFTPPAIASYLARWAIGSNPNAHVLDPTCGEAVFLLAAGECLRNAGATPAQISAQMTGVDLHSGSIAEAESLLAEDGLGARFLENDFFELPSPAQFGDHIGWQDAVVGNPPFVRYQMHSGDTRKRSATAAMAQGVRLSGLASSWAALLVHSSGFLKPNGRMGMVLPAELLTVSYAEPIRRWLLKRFGKVSLIMFESLQFEDAEEQVVLLAAQGSGGCQSFTLWNAADADALYKLDPLNATSVVPAAQGKWSDLLLPYETKQALDAFGQRFNRLDTFGTPELGTVTGANNYFAISEATRRKFSIHLSHVKPISPPGTRHLKSLTFSQLHWEQLKLAGERVWLLHPPEDAKGKGLNSYVSHGEALGIHEAYKCTVRTPWWRPPVVSAPDLFFTYMSHRYPRLIANDAGATFVNSMHGVRLVADVAPAREALPLVALNSLTMLSAEVLGRSYGGGILKMEPREAASLLVPNLDDLQRAWKILCNQRAKCDTALQRGDWQSVTAEVDRVLLGEVMRLSPADIEMLRQGASTMRVRRTRQTEASAR